MTGHAGGEMERPTERPDPTEVRLERELRALLRAREPGAAPLGLRQRVEAVPGSERPGDRGRVLRALAPILAAAAVLLVAIAAGQALRLSAPRVGPAGSPALSPASFDPGLVGPGIVAAPETGAYWALVLLGCGLLVLSAIAMRGRKRLVPAAVAALLFGWALVGSYYPVQVGVWFTGPRAGLVQAEMPPGVSLTQYYIVAAPGEPFVLGLGLEAGGGALPLRLDGVVGMPDHVIGPRWTALWLDLDRSGSGTARGPGKPFSPVDLEGPPQAVWVVGRAGECAAGPSFDQRDASGFAGGVSPSLRVSVSVLLWPREIDLTEPAILEPDVQPCSGAQPSPAPSGSASASPSP